MDSINKDKIAVIFIGIQASGKTTFYKNKFKNFAHINLDELHTRNKEKQAVISCIENGISFVVDNTNPIKSDREKYILLAKANKYKIKGYYFRSSINESIGRNAYRVGKAKVPNCAIASTHNKLELPEYKEGFDELYYVHIENEEFVVENWNNSKE